MDLCGKSSQYALLNVDKNGEYMNGSKTYKLNIPANVPAKDFWSIVAYDPQTRSQLKGLRQEHWSCLPFDLSI